MEKKTNRPIFDREKLIPTYFSLALPVVFSMVITLVYNLADTYFIARTDNALLVAGVSLCAPLFTMLMAIGNIFGQGGSSLISRLLGADDRESAARVSSFCFYLAILVGIVLAESALVFLPAAPLMRVFMEDPAIVRDGAVMLRWQISGLVFCAVVLLNTCLFQASGKAFNALLLSLSRQGVLFLAVFLIATAAAGYGGFLAAQLIADALSAALALFLYRRTFQKERAAK